ncbi:MAG: right-handed parallel beta-helix repeat-containing protein [Faecalibacterium sp.]
MEHILTVGKGQPLQTIAAALAAAKAYAPLPQGTAPSGTAEPVKIIVSGGEYPILAPLTITQSNLTLCAAQGEAVILTGSLPLHEAHWQPTAQNPNIYATPLEAWLAIDGFFVAGAPQILARFPNATEGVLPLGGVVDAATLKARAAQWQTPETGYLRALHHMGWGGNDYHITGKDATAETGLRLSWVGDNNRGEGYQATSLMVEGIFEELDAPGEWFYCAHSGMLYYYPPAELCLNATADTPAPQMAVALCAELLHIEGADAAHTVRNITLQGLTIQHTKRSLFHAAHSGKGYTPLLRGDWAVVHTGAITLKNAQDCAVNDCNFYHIGGNALFLDGYNAGHTIARNRLCHLGASGIQVVGSPCAVDDASFWQHAHYPDLQVHATTVKHPAQIGAITEDYPRDITITENYIYDIGQYEKQSCGVNLSIASRIRVLHNTIHKSARSNINVNDGSFGGHEIAYNDIFDAQRETTDHGPFNAWGRDRFWSVPRYNAIGEGGAEIRHYRHTDGKEYDTALLDAYQTTTIHHNRFHHAKGAPHTWGIDLDDGSSNYEIYSNLCLGLGIKLREGFARRVHHNIILEGKLEIHVPYTQAQDEIWGNLIVNHQPWNFIAVDAARFAAAEYQVDGNWYYNCAQPIVMPAWFANAQSATQGDGQASTLPDAHALFGDDPQFANPAAGDYTPTNTAAMQAVGFVPFAMEFGAALARKLPDGTAPLYEIAAGGSKAQPTYLWQRATLCDIDDAIMSATASAGYAGCYVVHTLGKAAALGLRSHDVIKEINGEAFADTLSFLTKMNALEQAGAAVTLTLHREGAVHTLAVGNG